MTKHDFQIKLKIVERKIKDLWSSDGVIEQTALYVLLFVALHVVRLAYSCSNQFDEGYE